MTEQTPAPAPEPEADEPRVVLRYTGADALALVASANPMPSTVQAGELVSVDRWAAESLAARDDFELVAGKALDAELKAAKLPTSGSAEEKRQRLADAEAARLADAEAARLADEAASAAATTPSTDEQNGQDA